MGRIWLGVGLLAVLFVLCFWVNIAMTDIHQSVCSDLTEAADKTLTGEMDAGITLARQAHEVWEQRWNITAAVADHAPMDEIDGLFAQLETYARAGQGADFAALCNRLSKLIDAVGEAHSLTWWNLL